MTRRLMALAAFAFLAQTALRADFQRAAGAFQLSTSTGTQTISGLGFQPKIVFLKWSGQTTTGTFAADYSIGYGAAISAMSRAAVFARQVNGVLNAKAIHADNRCLVVVSYNGTLTEAADFGSMDADGFSISVVTAGSAIRVTYEAWGGTAVTDVALVPFSTPTTTGSQTITGAGFAPDLAQFFTVGQTTAPPSSSTGGRFGLGFAASPTQQAGFGNSTLTSSSNDTGAQSTSKAIYLPDTSAMYLEGAVSSFDSDGVTLNYTKTPTSAVYAWAVFVKGLRAKVGWFSQPTSAQSQTITSLEFEPQATIFASYCWAAAAAQLGTAKVSLGFVVSPAEQSVNWAGANTSNNQSQMVNFANYAIACYTAAPSNVTLNSRAALASNNTDGMTITWSNADSTQRQVIFLAVAEKTEDEAAAPLLITQRFAGRRR
ncbi:MAG: hypothetical protein KIT09_11360 [Bryobacteraceae bacterium]|nr:hypothetical protein [Bryobacteraceae bacterium]